MSDSNPTPNGAVPDGEPIIAPSSPGHQTEETGRAEGSGETAAGPGEAGPGGPGPTGTAQDGAAASDDDAKSQNSLAGIAVGRKDGAGRTITAVYAKFSDFAIYVADSTVWCQLSDDPAKAREQNQKIAPLQPSRQKLEYIARQCGDTGEYVLRQIAAALRLALFDQTSLANAVLEDAIQNESEERARRSRLSFIPAASFVALTVATCLLVSTLADRAADIRFGMAGGALGAFLSMAIALRSREMKPELSRRANYIDSGLRVAIGMISGGALVLLMTSGLATALFPPDNGVPVVVGAAIANWRLAIVLGLAAGFSERLLPDLLSKQFPSSGPGAPPHTLKGQIAQVAAETEVKAKEATARAERADANEGGGTDRT